MTPSVPTSPVHFDHEPTCLGTPNGHRAPGTKLRRGGGGEGRGFHYVLISLWKTSAKPTFPPRGLPRCASKKFTMRLMGLGSKSSDVRRGAFPRIACARCACTHWNNKKSRQALSLSLLCGVGRPKKFFSPVQILCFRHLALSPIRLVLLFENRLPPNSSRQARSVT